MSAPPSNWSNSDHVESDGQAASLGKTLHSPDERDFVEVLWPNSNSAVEFPREACSPASTPSVSWWISLAKKGALATELVDGTVVVATGTVLEVALAWEAAPRASAAKNRVEGAIDPDTSQQQLGTLPSKQYLSQCDRRPLRWSISLDSNRPGLISISASDDEWCGGLQPALD